MTRPFTDAALLADVLTWRHIETAGGCFESHRSDAEAITTEYLRRARQARAEAGADLYALGFRDGRSGLDEAVLTGFEVHAAWRDGMLAQGRVVSRERMHWGTLTDEDRALDEAIAARLAALREAS